MFLEQTNLCLKVAGADEFLLEDLPLPSFEVRSSCLLLLSLSLRNCSQHVRSCVLLQKPLQFELVGSSAILAADKCVSTSASSALSPTLRQRYQVSASIELAPSSNNKPQALAESATASLHFQEKSKVSYRPLRSHTLLVTAVEHPEWHRRVRFLRRNVLHSSLCAATRKRLQSQNSRCRYESL